MDENSLPFFYIDERCIIMRIVVFWAYSPRHAKFKLSTYLYK